MGTLVTFATVPIFRAERAVSPADGTESRVVIDESFNLHVEATTWLASLRARDLSSNTERAYAGRVALFLTYCASKGLDWSNPELMSLLAFRGWLVSQPLPPRSRRELVAPRFRSEGAANAVLTAVCEFLRFGASQGWVPLEAVAVLAEAKYLKHLPPGYNAGELGEFRTVQSSSLRFRVAEPGYETLSEEQIQRMLVLARRARDRFLIALLACTGIRIGEALGMRREDLHLLPNSRSLGCQVEGAHIHIRRRPDNANKALAKSRFPRTIPVTDELIEFYADYQYERAEVEQAADCDMVFVNLFRGPIGEPMKYSNAKGMFDRLARAAGFAARPHMIRHTVATRWIRAGVDRDVAQDLLGHVSASSMQPYLHPTDDDKREAVERVGAIMRSAR